MTLDTVLSRNPQAAFRVYEGNATIILSDPGYTKILNEIGSTIWKQIDGKKTLGQILDAVIEEYNTGREEAERDLLEFAAPLHEHQMVT